MKNLHFIVIAVVAYFCSALLCGAEVPGVPRDSNFNVTGGYDSTRVHAQLVLEVKDDTQAVHFIRDNNDPRVVTKTYLLKNLIIFARRIHGTGHKHSITVSVHKTRFCFKIELNIKGNFF